MNYFIVALPLFDKNMSVTAYRMNLRDSGKLLGSNQGYTALDGAMNSYAIDVLGKTGTEPFAADKPILIDVNKFVLLMGFKDNCKIPYKKVILNIGNDVVADESYLEIINNLKVDGFKISIENVPYTQASKPFFKLADYIILDSNNKQRLEEIKFIFYDFPETQIILKNIYSKTIFNTFKNVPNALYGGTFYNDPYTDGATEITPLKANLLHLLKISSGEDFDFEDVSKTVQRDASLSISMLRFINSTTKGGSKITSIQNAVAFLGQKEVRKWISVAVSAQLAADKPNEITKISLVRAKFAENIAKYFEMAIHSQSLFLVGLFSLLDVVLEMPMEQAVKEIMVDDEIAKALVTHSGNFATILDLILSYERADWEKVGYLLILNNIKPSDIILAFIDTLVWYKELLQEIE